MEGRIRWEWIRRVSRAWECSVVEDVAWRVQRWWLSVWKQAQGDRDGRDSGLSEGWVKSGKLRAKEEGSVGLGDWHPNASKDDGLYKVEVVG